MGGKCKQVTQALILLIVLENTSDVTSRYATSCMRELPLNTFKVSSTRQQTCPRFTGRKPPVARYAQTEDHCAEY